LEDLLENWKSSQELVKVRRQRQIKICLGLTISGSLFLLVFGLLSLYENRIILGVMLLTAMVIGLINGYHLKVKDTLEQAVLILNGILLLLSLILVYTGGMNNTGLLWIYPILAISLFINSFSVALRISTLFILVCGVLLLTPLSQYLQADYSYIVSLRFLLTLLALSAICLVTLYSEEQAYNLVLKLHDNEVHRLAFYDSLTGLPNRWSFQQNLARILEQKTDDKPNALLYLDLDNFKFVNDNYGHDIGDELLKDFGKKICQCINLSVQNTTETVDFFTDINDDVSRLAGDEFVVILQGLSNRFEVELLAERIVGLFDGGYSLDANIYPVFISVGIALFPNDTSNAEQLLRYADAAMYKSKKKGNNNIQFFDSALEQELIVKQHIETGLQKAVETHRFSLVYQPIYCVKTGKIEAIEALIRCHTPELQGYGPDQFIAVAESNGLIKKIDDWVLEHAISEFMTIRASSHFTGKLAINVSGIALLDEHFPQKVKAIADIYQLPCSDVEIEITETAFVPDNPTVDNVLSEFSQLGLSLSLDDFGTGYTSFNQLILYPAQQLKIDRVFVNDLFSSDESLAKVVKTLYELAKIYDLKVIAEGVENQQQFDYLKAIGCDSMQGYYLSKPLSAEQLIPLLSAEHSA
jgi:diguanylate cyclase (GGDEF)-like protein